MEAEKTRFGSSLPVPCVQELAKDTPKAVPPRYLRPDQDPPFISNSTYFPQLPVIDMHLLFAPDFMDYSELQKLHLASKEWGFFLLINHGVSSSLLEKVKSGIQQLFNMEMEEKKKYWQGQGEGEVEGFGQVFVVSEEQKLDWGDTFTLITLPMHLFEEAPLVPSPSPPTQLAIGLNAYSDATGLAILLQLNEMEGLQVRKDGMWIPIKPLPNAFVVNIGDVLEIVTNGIYRSIEHRATVNSEKERLSIATFLSPKLEGDFGPASSLVNADSPKLFKRIGLVDYLKGYLSRKLDGKSYVDAMRI